ncbi:MAG TPA: carboxypeptidase regulatory-like domain-containing protein [Candidatus Acidoferrum sp.]
MRCRTSVFVSHSLSLLFTLTILVLGARPLHAQVDAGSILGTVTDQSGAVVSGAKVTLTNEGTGASLATTTGDDGVYKFTPVKIGSYKLDVAYQGFQSMTAKGVTVDVGSNVVQNFTLKPGNVSQSIEVTAAPPLLESQSASVGQVVDARSVNDLPLNGRNFTFLAQIAAGVNTPQADTRGNAASGAFAANGLRPSQNNYLLDGVDNNSDTVDFLNGTNYIVLPPVDAVQEFKVQTSDFSAEFGRSGAAVLNATIKSGTNEFHGTVWEFFRNSVLDAADWFENAGNIKKGALQQNQFGVAAGGPVVIPHVFNGRNKLFIFGDYEGFRRVQGQTQTGSVPTVAERNSGFTNFADLITLQSSGKPGTDILGRTLPLGTIVDPATTRALNAGQVDAVTGLTAVSTGYVRDPFGVFGTAACPFSTTNFSGGNIGACQLNQIPAGRLDPNAIALLKLYPLPTTGSLLTNYATSPKLYEHRNAFDVRMDANISDKNQVFFRFSYVDDPQFIPGLFTGIADGGAFQQGNQTAIAQQGALGWTHTFSPTLINEGRIGFNYLHTTRAGPVADQLGIPEQYGIQDVPQVAGNGGLPAFGFNGGLSTLGSNAFLPSNEVSQTLQLTDDVTKIFGKHTFKMGFEWQHVKFTTLQPPWSHGEYDYNGAFTDLAGGSNSGNTGRADFLLIPTAASVPGGVNYVGGSSQVYLSNIALTDDGKNYWGAYVNDSWKVNAKLTVNLGLRYDYFGLVGENHSNQANYVPNALGNPVYLIPNGPNAGNLSPSFISVLGQSGVSILTTNAYGSGLGHTQTTNWAPRIGIAYQATPKLVVRAGWGIFYNGFENRGYSPNIGENYPFQFQFNFPAPNSVSPYTFTTTSGAICPTFSGGGPAGGPPIPAGGTATFETGFSCTPLDPLLVNANGLALLGIQFNYQTPYNMGANLTAQYQITPTLALTAGYVGTSARHLEVFPNSTNSISTIAYYNAPTSSLIPYPSLARNPSYAATEGNSNYNGLLLTLEKRFASGLNFLATYTYSKTLTDAHDLLNGGSLAGYRAPAVPGFGIHGDYGLAPFDIRNVFHFSGGYQLPLGKGQHFLSDATGLKNQVVGGWSLNWLMTFQGGQPISLSCPSTTAAGLGCGDLFVKGQPLKLGLHTDSNGKLSWFGNPAAFNQPCQIGSTGAPLSDSPQGCVPLTGLAALGGLAQVPGPKYSRVDFSIFKNFPIKESVYLQFRTEIFNIANHPTFNAPNFGGNGVVAVGGSGNYTSSTFGEIGSTRTNPYDARQIQFALKFYF